MALFPRRRRRVRKGRVDLGEYVDPEPRELASVERVAEEGLLIAASAVRLAVKNRVVVRALRDQADYDLASLSGYARDELLALAEEKRSDVQRARGTRSYGDTVEMLRLRRLAESSERLAELLEQAAADEEYLADVVAGARDSAWSEIGSSIRSRLLRSETLTEDPEYARDRDMRIRALKGIDLMRLERDSAPEY